MDSFTDDIIEEVFLQTVESIENITKRFIIFITGQYLPHLDLIADISKYIGCSSPKKLILELKNISNMVKLNNYMMLIIIIKKILAKEKPLIINNYIKKINLDVDINFVTILKLSPLFAAYYVDSFPIANCLISRFKETIVIKSHCYINEFTIKDDLILSSIVCKKNDLLIQLLCDHVDIKQYFDSMRINLSDPHILYPVIEIFKYMKDFVTIDLCYHSLNSFIEDNIEIQEQIYDNIVKSKFYQDLLSIVNYTMSVDTFAQKYQTNKLWFTKDPPLIFTVMEYPLIHLIALDSALNIQQKLKLISECVDMDVSLLYSKAQKDIEYNKSSGNKLIYSDGFNILEYLIIKAPDPSDVTNRVESLILFEHIISLINTKNEHIDGVLPINIYNKEIKYVVISIIRVVNIDSSEYIRILLKYGSTLVECCIVQLLLYVKIDYGGDTATSATPEVATAEDAMATATSKVATATATSKDATATIATPEDTNLKNCIDFLSSICLDCGASNPIMYMCNKCKRFCYCSKKCQRKNLQYHKAICK